MYPVSPRMIEAAMLTSSVLVNESENLHLACPPVLVPLSLGSLLPFAEQAVLKIASLLCRTELNAKDSSLLLGVTMMAGRPTGRPPRLAIAELSSTSL
ncbi:hypothetical protein [Phaffia rhodozyma]|uniref:Uncharacterized protein n=1 Tax=Phaffia rhodozyma TaxID=264483 RepID=A0A0F7SF00_PHARH|nr:hypothetical protein [Phaffia rhodozyma]